MQASGLRLKTRAQSGFATALDIAPPTSLPKGGSNAVDEHAHVLCVAAPASFPKSGANAARMHM